MNDTRHFFPAMNYKLMYFRCYSILTISKENTKKKQCYMLHFTTFYMITTLRKFTETLNKNFDDKSLFKTQYVEK